MSAKRYRSPDNYKSRACPGCSIVGPLAEGSICRTCSDNLQDYHRLKPVLDQMLARETTPVNFGERAAVPTGVKYISTRFGEEGRDEDNGTEAAVHFGTAVKALLMELAGHRPAAPDSWGSWGAEGVSRHLNHRKDGTPVTAIELTRGATEALRSMYVATNQLLREAVQEGRTRGMNLLGQLAAGEATVNDFEGHLEDIARNQREAREISERSTGDLRDPPKRRW